MSRQNDSLEQLHDDAIYDMAMGNIDQCIEKLKKILEIDPKHFDSQLALGTAFMRKGDYHQALEEGLKAAVLSPENQMAQMNLSMFYIRLGNKKKAEEHALKAKLAYWKKQGSQPPSTPDKILKQDIQILSQTPSHTSMIFTKKKENHDVSPIPKNK